MGNLTMPGGRPPKPTIIKKLEGNRSKVGRNHLRPDLTGPGSPRIPSHLTLIEQAIWRDIAASLPPGLLCRADSFVLERMAVATAQFRHATKKLRPGLTKRTRDGEVRSAWLLIQRQAGQTMDQCGSELGLSPVARVRLSQPTAPPPDDPMAQLLDEFEAEDAGVTTTRQ